MVVLKKLYVFIGNARKKFAGCPQQQQWQPILPVSVKQRLKVLQSDLNKKRFSNMKKERIQPGGKVQKRKSEGDDCLLKISTEVYQQWVEGKVGPVPSLEKHEALKFDKIHIVPPTSDTGESEMALKVLAFLGKAIRLSQSYLEKLHEEGQMGERGCTMINNKRYMISIPKDACHVVNDDSQFEVINTVFKTVVSMWEKKTAHKLQPVDVWRIVVTYCITQASRDLLNNRSIENPNFQFDTFTVIAAYGKVSAQRSHLDMYQETNYQCSMFIHEGDIEATNEFSAAESEGQITSAEDLVCYGADAWVKVRDIVVNILNNSVEATDMLKKFGALLLPKVVRVDNQNDLNVCNLYDIGTCMTLPGGVIHAGPKSQKFRAILFFTATPKGNLGDVYDSDTQHNRTSLSLSLVNLVFPEVKKKQERSKLLDCIIDSMKRDKDPSSNDMVRHVPLRQFSDAVNYILHKKSCTEQQQQKQLEEAKQAFLHEYNEKMKTSSATYWESSYIY